MITRKFLLATAALGCTLFSAPQLEADTVWASKDCSLSPCVITTGNNTISPMPLPPGQFRKTGPSAFWSANYFGTPNRFWVGTGGMNFADQQLSTAPGDSGGTISVANGLWYISVRTALMGPGNYSVSGANVLGDPHITTLDGVHYDFQGAGEFILLRTDSAGFELQSRMSPVATGAPLPPDPHTGLSSCPSINTAAALRSPAHRITFQPGRGTRGAARRMLVRIDGRIVAVGSRGIVLGDGTRIWREPQTGALGINLRSQWGVKITPNWWAATKRWYLDYDFNAATDATGIVGNIAERSWLPALADGSSVGGMPQSLADRYDVLYRKFADSWRVSAATSLFDYAPGTSNQTFADPRWPGTGERCEVPGMTPVHGMDRATAEQACSGVIVPHFRDMCVIDAMATGDRTFATGYLTAQGPMRSSMRMYDDKAQAKP